MEIKKNPKVDLNNKRGLFLEVGLILSLALVIVAFAYTPKERTVEELDVNQAIVDVEVVDITTQEEKPVEPPKSVAMPVLSNVINVVSNDTKINTSFEFTDFSENVEIAPVATVTEEVVADDEPFLFAEEMPTFQGGDLNVFRSWVQSQLNYPIIAQENGISGQVTLSFVIERDGSLTNIQILQSPDRSLSEEAIRVLKLSPKWTPGKQRNTPVRVKYNLPVIFRLSN